MSSFTYDDAIDLVLGKSTTPPRDSWDDAIDSVLGGPQYVAGGPGGIPGAKDVPGQSLALSPEVQIKQFRALVAGQGGDLSGKSDAEVAMLMHRFNTTGGQEMADYQPEKTRAGEFGRGLRRGVAYGLPLGIPGVEAMRENEQVQRAPEGVAGFAGETLGGFAGMLNPEQAPANALAIALTGGMGRAIAPIVGRVGEIAGPRVARAVQEAIINAGQGGGIAALQEAGRITPQEWAEDPAGSLLRIGKAAGIGAGAGGALGGGIGALGKAPVDYPAGTLPETLAPQTAADGRAAMAEQGQAAMRDVADVYRGAPRANESDPAVLAARNAADAQALAQAEASARAYDAEMMGAADIARRRAAASAAESAKIIENAPEPARVETPETQIGANREEAQGQAQGNQEGLLSKEPPSPDTPAAVDWSTKSYAEIRARAKELGVLDGPKTRAALVERLSAAETRSAQGTPTPESPEPASGRMGNGAAPAKETPSAATSQPSRPATADAGSGSFVQRSASPNPTRQPWEMTRDEASAAFNSGDPSTFSESRVEDWGRIRQQGKRSGGMVMGGMADPPRGKKSYTDMLAKLGLTDEQRRELGSATQHELMKYAKARASGFDHDNAMIYSYSDVGEPHRVAVENALREGRPVPPAVLADYPDLVKPKADAGQGAKQPWEKTPVEKFVNKPLLAFSREYGREVLFTPSAKGGGGWQVTRFSDDLRPSGDTFYPSWEEAVRTEMRYGLDPNTARAPDKLRPNIALDIPSNMHPEKMTLRDFQDRVQGDRILIGDVATAFDEATKRRHRDEVEIALTFGNPVPPEVLKDYPDLAASAKPPTPAEPGTTPAGTGAKPGESPKASVTDYPGKAPDTAPSEGIAGTAAKEAPEQPVPSTPKTSATAEPAVEPPASSPKTSSSGNAPEPTAQSAPESPRPERPASKDRQTSDDFTARRVVNKPEPGEPEGPVTAAKNEMTSAMREALNLQAFDSPERRTWQATLDTAVARGIPAKSLDIAAEVNLKPRVLAPEEEAGMTYRLVELSNEKRDIAGKLDGAKTDADRVALLASDERATQEIDAITTALNKGGTEAGRALNIRRMLLKDDYSLARVKLQIKKAEMAGAKFSPEQVKELESLAVRIEKASKDLESIAQKSLDQQAENTIKRHAASKRGLPAADRERVITELADSVRTLLSQGCR